MKKVIALDIGGTNFRGAVFNEKFEIEKRLTLKTERNDVITFLNESKNLIDSLMDNDIVSIAIGVPGRVKNDGYIYALPNMGIKDIDLISYLIDMYHLPVTIKNDAVMAAIGEKTLGAGKDKKSLYFITISTGLGGALCIDNDYKITSVEVGHEIVLYKNKMKEYERLVSGSGIINLAKLNKLKISNSKEFFDLVKNKNEKALLVYKDWIKLLAKFIKYINETYEPDVIALTGGVMKSKDIFFFDLKEECKLDLLECKLKEDAGLYGSAVEAYKLIK